MPSILIAEDNDEMRDALAISIRKLGHNVLAAPNGKIARDLLGSQEVDLIISDVQMPFLDGLDLLDWCKKNHKSKFILMTGFSHLLETQSAYERGADEFIAKPFKFTDFQLLLEKVLRGGEDAPASVEKGAQEKYCKVSIDEFVTKPQIEFDIYIKLSEQKHIKIGYAGTHFSVSQLERYKKHGVKYLYITAIDFPKFVRANLEIAKVVKSSRSISREKKLNFVRYVGDTLMEKVFTAGVDQETLFEAKDFMNVVLEAIGDNADSFELIEIMDKHSDKLTAQCVSAALYSVMIARKMGLTSVQSFYKLSMAGFFHEIGMKEIDNSILDKPRHLLSQSERQQIESHTIRGKEILIATGHIPDDVIQLVAEHHEDVVGTGYPRALKKNRQHPLSPLMQVATLFSQLSLKRDPSKTQTLSQIFKFMVEMYGDRLDKSAMTALMEIHGSEGA